MADDDINELLRQVEASLGTPKGAAAPGSSPVPQQASSSPAEAGGGVPVSRVVGALIAGGVAGLAVWLVLTLASSFILPAVLVAFVATAIAWIVR